MRAVRVVVLEVLPEHDREVARSGDQKVIEAFAALVPIQRSAMAFVRGARTGVRMMSMSAPAMTASKARRCTCCLGRGSETGTARRARRGS